MVTFSDIFAIWQDEIERKRADLQRTAQQATNATNAYVDYAESKGWLIDGASLKMKRCRKDAEFDRLKRLDIVANDTHVQVGKDWSQTVSRLLNWASTLHGDDWQTFRQWALSQSGEILTGAHSLMLSKGE